jgi:hypothetical protein
MKRETLKEIGKLIYDFSKIIFAIAVLAPIAKGEHITGFIFLPILIGVGIGTYLINKGVKDE